jgi:cellulose biosynthesis protein BcsQ
MIKIIDVAYQLNNELSKLKKIKLDDFRIFIRLNLELDVYIITESQDLINSLIKKYSDFVITFKRFSKNEVEEYSYLTESFKTENKIDFGLKYRYNSLLNKRPNFFYNVDKKFTIPIVTFYSYKGGMGRTTAMTSYALDLAINHNKKVCVIDCDFEAPGYLNFFNLASDETLRSGAKNGVIEFLTDHSFKKKINIEDYYIELKKIDGTTDKLKNLFIVPAGNLSDTTLVDENGFYSTHRDQYLEGLARVDLSNERNIINGFEQLFSLLKEKIKPDIFLLDSRTGFNDVFGITALILSDLIVGFFGSSDQTKPGLRFLLDRFYELKHTLKNNTELLLINSILPTDEKESELFHTAFVNEVGQYLQFIQEKKFNKASTEDTELPKFYKLSRNKILERIGISSNEEGGNSDYKEHIELIKRKAFQDYNLIFNALNETRSINKIFPLVQEIKPTRSIELKNIILKKLKFILRNENNKPALFAEDAEINPKTFFYREQMNDIFDSTKFIIQGFKGTGKTYLYKALRDPKLDIVKNELLRRSNANKNADFRFIDIISLKGQGGPKSFDFDNIKLSQIEDKAFYFKYFWIVYTWNSIFLDSDEKLGYKNVSSLKEYIKPILSDLPTKQRFEELINDESKLIEIEKDLISLDEYLTLNNIKLIILFDQLDNLIAPNHWGETVTPLIDYWWDNLNRFKSIAPKIFIRTDLFKRLKTTNTLRLENNKIEIEWSREEVYAFFFKLVFSEKESYDAIFEIMKRSQRYDDRFISNTKRFLEKNDNQLNLFQNEIDPFMTVFFGKEVRSSSGGFLGNTFDWFYFNLTNADQKSISLRPFINLINGSIDTALTDPEIHVTQIIHYKYFSSRENRDNAVKQHFDDLTREDFNKDLAIIFNYIKEKGEAYKQIFLYKSELLEMLDKILKEYYTQLENKTVEDLKDILVSNGIIYENVRPHENIFYFAQLYKYWLGLQSRKYDYKRPAWKK